MRLRRLSLKNITRFDQAEVDFEALGPGLVAIAGPNGAGKTTILEAPFAALYGEFPTRPGSLYGVAHGKDACIELEVDNGQPYRALISVDADHQRSEAYLFDEDGEPVTNGKVREYAAAIEKRFGSARLMLSAALSCQTKRGSFLDLSKAERKDLLAEILDTAGLQQLSEAARARFKAGELTLERLRGQLAEAEAELQRLAGAGQTDHLTAERDRLDAEIGTASLELETARTRLADLQTQHALAVEAEKQRAAKQKEADQVLAQEKALSEKSKALPQERVRAKDRAQAAILEAEGEAEHLPEYQAAAEALPPARGRRTQAQDDLREHNAALREARETLLEKTRETGKAAAIRERLARAQRQAGLLGEVPCTITSEWEIAGTAAVAVTDLAGTCPLLADARGAKATIAALEGELAAVEALEAGLTEYQQAVDRAEVAVKDGLAACQKVETEVQRLEPLSARAAVAQAAVQRAAQIHQQLEETLATLTSRQQEYADQKDALVRRHSALLADVKASEAGPDATALLPEMRTVEQTIDGSKLTIAKLQMDITATEKAITQAEAQAQRHAELTKHTGEARTQAATLEADLGEWVTLERALGRDGIQALEIDAAGPELSALTNELLTSCFGPRFEVRFVTQALKADGKAQKEVFDVAITDHERGREGVVDSLSGGEKVIVSEAISLALAIYVGKHSGRRYETLFRDETAGQLDPDNAQRYVAMLRKARVMAGAHQVVFIAQQPEVWQSADAVLYLQDGRVEIRQ